MRKVLSVILAAGLALGLTACSGGGGTTDTTAANTSESTAAESSEAKEESGERVWPTTKNVEIICPASAGGLTDSCLLYTSDAADD